jgi:hypothetical protein
MDTWFGRFFPAMTFMQHASNLAWQHCLLEGHVPARFVQPKKSHVQSAENFDRFFADEIFDTLFNGGNFRYRLHNLRVNFSLSLIRG